jgi:hypothetical protein
MGAYVLHGSLRDPSGPNTGHTKNGQENRGGPCYNRENTATYAVWRIACTMSLGTRELQVLHASH